jgi:hypothetical protein
MAIVLALTFRPPRVPVARVAPSVAMVRSWRGRS